MSQAALQDQRLRSVAIQFKCTTSLTHLKQDSACKRVISPSVSMSSSSSNTLTDQSNEYLLDAIKAALATTRRGATALGASSTVNNFAQFDQACTEFGRRFENNTINESERATWNSISKDVFSQHVAMIAQAPAPVSHKDCDNPSSNSWPHTAVHRSLRLARDFRYFDAECSNFIRIYAHIT